MGKSRGAGKRIQKWLMRVLVPFGLVRENLRGIMLFEALYRLLVWLVFFPILTWIYRLLPFVNGTSIIAAYNINSVFRNPLSWLVFLLLAVLMTVFASFERFAIVDALHASKCGLKRSVKQIFSTGVDLTVQNLRLKNVMLIPYVLIILHFGSFSDISGITSFIKLPGSFWESLDKYPWQMALYAVWIIITFYINIRAIFAVPVMMEEDSTSFYHASIKSAKMTKGRYTLRLLLIMAFWGGLLTLLSALFALAIVVVWFLLSLWLQPGQTENIVAFVRARYAGTDLVCGLVTSWLLLPLTLASFQSAYYERKKDFKEDILDYTEEPNYLKHNRTFGTVFTLVIAVSIFFSGPRRFSQVKWMMNTSMGTPLIMAHRGYSQAAPENTLPAFEKAIDSGFTAAELDVQMTKDGEIVLLHDSNLKRTTGLNLNIWDVTYDEIKNLDNGSFFSSEYAGTKIPTLDQVLKLCKDKLYLNIEIKRTGHDDGIVERVIKVIEDNDYFDNCDITSQNYATLEEVRAINPDILTAYTSSVGIGRIQNLDAADILSIMESSATYTNVEAIQNAGKRIFVWTVNERKTMETLINLNVDAILTNDPKLCQKVIDRYSSEVMNIVRRLTNALAYL